MDPEALVQCPYDTNHRIRVSRLPYHLVKCQQNNPQVARTLAACPFNARHRVPQAKLRIHVASCPDRRQSDLPHEIDVSLGNGVKEPEVHPARQDPPCQEDWEAELEELEDPPPFVLNVTTNDLLLPCDGSAPAAPESRTRGGGAAGRHAAGTERRARERTRTAAAAAAGPGRCPSAPQNRGGSAGGGQRGCGGGLYAEVLNARCK